MSRPRHLAPTERPEAGARTEGRPESHPGIDVVLATHERPAMLREALHAVVGQTWPGHLTVHVVFDGTPPDPDLQDLVSGRENRSLVLLSNHRTPGLAGARNTGILAGTSPVVCFCDDDDVWRADKVWHQMTTAAHTQAETVVSGIVVEYRGAHTTRVPRARDLTPASLARRRVMEAHPSTVMVSREALLGGIGLVDEEIPGSYGEDFDWILRAARHSPIAVSAAPLVRVRWGESHFSRDWEVIVAAIDYGLAKHPAFHEDPRALGRLLGRQAFAQAAMHRPEAWATARRAVRTSPVEIRAWLAVAVASRLVSAERLVDLAHRRGRGI